jgi:hypothetical protein
MEVRLLPGALMLEIVVSTMDTCFMDALVAQLVELPVLTRMAAGSSPAGCTERKKGKLKEVGMRRVISLFREPDEGYALPASLERSSERSEGAEADGEDGQPLYFVQLLAHLREQREAADEGHAMAGARD